MELMELTRKNLEKRFKFKEMDEEYLSSINKRRIVIVEFKTGKCLTFLVADEESPLVPGYPACSLSYYDSIADAQKAIKELYDKLNYYPDYSSPDIYRSREKGEIQ